MQLIAMILLVWAVIALQGRLFRKRALQKLDYQCGFSKSETVEGDTIELVESIANRKLLPIPWLKTELTTSRWLDFAGQKSVVTDETRFVPSIFMLKGYQSIARRWKVRCLKRGEFRLTRVNLVTSDLFGGESLSGVVDVGKSVTVLPRLVELDELFTSAHLQNGDTVTQVRLLEDPFLVQGVREYTGRESMNKLHWMSTARLGEPMVRNNDFTTGKSLTVLLNMQSQPAEQGKVVNPARMEQAIRVCATLIDRAAGESIPVRFGSNTSLDGDRGTILTGESVSGEFSLELMRLLSRLSLVSTEEAGKWLGDAAEQIDSSDAALVTAFLDDGILSFYHRMRARGVRVTLYVMEYLSEAAVPEGVNLLTLRQMETQEGAGYAG